LNEGIGNTFVSSRSASTKIRILFSSWLSNGQRNWRRGHLQQIRSEAMRRVEATIRNDKEIPFSITAVGADRVSLKADTHYAGLVCEVASCELNLAGSQLIFGCACFLGAARLFLWALFKLWLFVP
jgi:hypothetical protein